MERFRCPYNFPRSLQWKSQVKTKFHASDPNVTKVQEPRSMFGGYRNVEERVRRICEGEHVTSAMKAIADVSRVLSLPQSSPSSHSRSRRKRPRTATISSSSTAADFTSSLEGQSLFSRARVITGRRQQWPARWFRWIHPRNGGGVQVGQVGSKICCACT
eukprot:263214-Hanusia_phi.AAC.5